MKLVGEYQLSLHVDAPPSLRDPRITDADGQPLSSATLKVRQVQFKVLEIGEVTVGIERRHTARLEEGVAVR